MVGLVVVSHSAGLAAGIGELVRGLGGESIPFRAVGGLDLPGQPLGTDAAAVQRAIEEVWSPDGVLVLADLGSAVLSAELAKDLLGEGQAERVLVCDAPLVEGAVAAAVLIGLGGSLAEVAAEARASLGPKREQLQAQGPAAAPHRQEAAERSAPADVAEAAPLTLRFALTNRHGLHARPVARLVRALATHPEVEVRLADLTSGRGPVDARSFTAVATLGALSGHELELTARGPGSAAALEAVKRLADAGFGDRDEPSSRGGAASRGAGTPSSDEGRLSAGSAAGATAPVVLRGTPAAPGVALGPARRVARHRPLGAGPAASGPVAPVAPEAERGERALAAACDRARARLAAQQKELAGRAGPEAAALLDAQLLLLDDLALLAPARADQREGATADGAWRRAVEAAVASFEALADPYQRGRSADVRALGELVLAEIHGPSPASVDETPRRVAPQRSPISGPGIAVARDVTPVEVARLEALGAAGLALAEGAPTSHAAILARTLGVPMVTGLGEALLDLPESTPLGLDGDAGLLWPAPAPGGGGRPGKPLSRRTRGAKGGARGRGGARGDARRAAGGGGGQHRLAGGRAGGRAEWRRGGGGVPHRAPLPRPRGGAR